MAKYAPSDRDRDKDRPNVRFRRAEQPLRRRHNALIMLIVATAMGALLVGKQLTKKFDGTSPGEEESEESAPPDSAAARQALDYIRAVQENDWGRVFEMTQWMQKRVEHLRAENTSETAHEEIESFYQQEKESFFAVNAGPNLSAEGIRDAHLFPQGAKVRVVDVAEGLSRPILNESGPVSMVVVEVEYPLSSTAPITLDERRIEKLRAAIYLTPDGKIVKASVRGNTRVDLDSVLVRRLTPGETRRLRRQTGESAG